MNTKDFYFGFLENFTTMQKGRVIKILDKLYRYSDYGILSRKEFIEKCILKGSYVKHETNVKTWTRNGEKIQANYYSLHQANKDYFHEITKTEYKYGQHLINNGYDNKNKMQKYITAETARQEEEKRIRIKKEQQEKEEKERQGREYEQFNNWLLEQALQYPKNEKYNMLKEIYFSELGNFYDNATRLLVLIDNINNSKCKEKLKDWLHNGNQISKKVFYHVTGIKLPNTHKGTIEVIENVTNNDYTEIIPYKKRKKSEKAEQKTFYVYCNNEGFREARGEHIQKYGFDLYIRKSESGRYSITEGQTGLLVAQGCDTKTDLMKKLKENIDRIGLDKFNKHIQGFIEKKGISPLYQKSEIV